MEIMMDNKYMIYYYMEKVGKYIVQIFLENIIMMR